MQTTTVEFAASVFELDVVKRAAYKFTDTLIFDFDLEGGRIICRISAVSGITELELEEVLGRFKTEVLDQDLRRTISEETSAIRNVILAHVFSRTGLADDDSV